jgi:hypothetical protein
MSHIPSRSAVPFVLWAAAMWLLVAATAWALPAVGPSLDFAQGGSVAGHIADRSLTPIPVIQNAAGAWPLLLAYLAAFGLACAAYVAVLRTERLDARVVAATFAAGACACLAVPFFPTSDPYAYALYALEAGPLHLNPYVSQPLAGVALPWAAALAAIFPDPGAYVRHCNYGPVAAFAYAALALPLAHAPLAAYLYAERAFGAACVAIAALVAARVAPEGERTRRFAAYALHPLVLTEFVAFAHGDALMIALLAAAFACRKRGAVAWSAAFCVAAAATRSVAVLGLVALFVDVARERPAALLRAAAGAAAAALAVGAASLLAFGDVSLGGAPAFNRFAAPLSYVAAVLGSPLPLATAVAAQAAFGMAIAIVALRRWWARVDGGLAWLSVAALAGLPAVYPHYVGWVAATGALRPGRRFEAVALAAGFSAPLWYVARMNLIAPPQPSALAYGVAILATWGAVVAAFALTGRSRAQAAPAPEVHGVRGWPAG